MLYRGTWKPAAEITTLPTLLKELTQQDLEKLTGNAKLDNYGLFELDLYNGSDFTLKEITVEFVVRDSRQEEVLRRSYRYPHEQASRKIDHYTEELDFSIGPQQGWSWKIVGAKGIKS